MNNKNLMDALTDIDTDLLAHAEKSPSPVPVWLRLCAAAACLCLLIGVALSLIPKPTDNHPTIFQSSASTTGIPIPPTPTPTTKPSTSAVSLNGSALEYVVGDSIEMVDGMPKPPRFMFDSTGFMVQVKVDSVLPDTYYKLEHYSTYKATAYKLIRMQVIHVINGEGIGEQFLYMLPESMVVDFSVYDCLLVNMDQKGTCGYVLRNATKNQIEAFSEPIFGDLEVVYVSQPRSKAQLGNVIAFSDGVFDESLWKSPGWNWGHQFFNWSSSYQVVQPGTTLEQAIENIRANIHGATPVVKTLQFTTPEAQAACEYARPFVNGVFAQELLNYGVRFRRYINGCSTEETFFIYFEDERVTFSNVRYTQEEIVNLENISTYLSALAQQYATSTPAPPHTDPAGKDLKALSLSAWYMKVDGKIYGVIKTVWIFHESKIDSLNRKGLYAYYDDNYRIFDGTAESGQLISRDDLLELIGSNHYNVYSGKYDVGQGVTC